MELYSGFVMEYVNLFKAVLTQEADAIIQAREKLTLDKVHHLIEIFDLLGKTGNCLVFLGVGKSGQVAQKLASTFSSLGLPSYFLHPVEALHGDLGRVQKGDCFVLISNSGTTEELVKLLPFLNTEKQRMIGLIGNTKSPLADECGLVFDCSVEREACLNNQAPTTSTTLAMAMGDAMAVVFEKMSGLSKEGFAVNHPGGKLGKSLLMKVSDLMWKKDACPVLKSDSTIKEMILMMTQFNVGGGAVVDEDGKLQGIVVEGDIRRAFANGELDLNSSIQSIYNSGPIKVLADDLAFTALKLMEERENQISLLPVVDSSEEFLGFIRLHDLLREGFSLN